MKFKQKVGYMLIGCLFTIVGYILASFGGITTNAQDEETSTFDRIVCNELLVVQKAGPPAAYIGSAKTGGLIEVYNRTGRVVSTHISAPDDHGRIIMRDKAGKIYVSILNPEDGGISVHNKSEVPVASISASEDVGSIGINNKLGKGSVNITTDEHGNGVIETYNGVWRKY
ncbi:MAG: hypothetical protein OXM61_07555 [Candidatus Poribacteria bacterium]|nr:hypothetical protein [Candidatus Poribacteria bacterium]